MKNKRFYIIECLEYDPKVIAAYVSLKNIHSNSIFYNFTYNKLSVQSGQCFSTIKKIVKLLIDNKLAEITKNGHLKLVSKHWMSTDSLHSKKFRNWFEVKSVKYKDILKEIRTVFLLNKFKQMQFVRKASNDLHNSKSVKDLRKARKFAVRYEKGNRKLRSINQGESWTDIRIGTKKIGDIVGVSQSHASRLMKGFCKDANIEVKTGGCFSNLKNYIKSESNKELVRLNSNRYLDTNIYRLDRLYTINTDYYLSNKN